MSPEGFARRLLMVDLLKRPVGSQEPKPYTNMMNVVIRLRIFIPMAPAVYSNTTKLILSYLSVRMLMVVLIFVNIMQMVWRVKKFGQTARFSFTNTMLPENLAKLLILMDEFVIMSTILLAI